MRRWLIALLLVAALALLLQWTATAAPSVAPSERDGGPADVAPATGGGDADEARSTDGSAVDRRPATPTAERGEWTLRLLGIVPGVPWTAPLELGFEGVAIQAAVDTRGVCRFVPPAIARLVGVQNMRLGAADDHYRIGESHQSTIPLQQQGHLDVVVYPVARLQGRVLGPDGHGIAARVRAFALGPDGPGEPVLARTESGPDGSYLLRTPPGSPLLLLAEATVEVPTLLDVGPRTLDDVGSGAVRVRTDLLPASVRAEGDHVALRSVPDLRLRRTATLTGRVALADGSALANADVIAQPSWARAPAWHDPLYWSPTAGLGVGARARTDRQGAFSLDLAPGELFSVRASATEPLFLGGEPVATASAPGQVELVAPGELLTLRAVQDGAPVPRAWLDLGDVQQRADGAGERRVLLGPRPVRLRARAEAFTSAWTELPSGVRPAIVTLEIVTVDRASVRLLLRSRPALLTATFTWQPLPNGTPITLSSARERGDLPFVLQLPPGRYRLSMTGDYLLPQHFDLDVPAEGLTVAHEAATGGRLALDVFDARGVRLAGIFALGDAAGREMTSTAFTYQNGREAPAGAAGVLLPHGRNHLETVFPPGSYTLSIETAEHRRAQQQVTIWAGTWATAVLRLP